MTNSLTYFKVIGSWEDLEIYTPPTGGGYVATADIDLVNALVDFIPRVPLGHVFNVDNLVITPATNEVQRIRINGTVSGGTFTLSFAGTGPSGTIPYNGSAAQVETALEALASIGSGNVSVTGANGGPWDVEFVGDLAATNIADIGVLSANWSLLTPSGANILFTLTTPGTPLVSRDTAVHLDTFVGRITNGVLCTPAAPSDVPGVALLANSAVLNYMDDTVDPPVPATLYWDVRFRNVTGADFLQNFSFAAPTSSIQVDITDPDVTRFAYAPLPR